MIKPVYLVISILKTTKIVMCKFWYNYEKPKYTEKEKLCYIDRDTFIMYLKQKKVR